jgi:hypothetical protein
LVSKVWEPLIYRRKAIEWNDSFGWLGVGGSIRNLSFGGTNVRSRAVQIRNAFITSKKTGTALSLMDQDEVIDVPSGARIDLTAEFDPPKALTDKFVEEWGSVYLEAQYDGRLYKKSFNDPGTFAKASFAQLGPRATRRRI